MYRYYTTGNTRDSGIAKLDSEGNVVCYIPDDINNNDWQEYQAWLAADPENNIPQEEV